VFLFKKLQNPFVLIGQGFAIGALVFWTTRADAAGTILSFFS
jgi:hypothetical protein